MRITPAVAIFCLVAISAFPGPPTFLDGEAATREYRQLFLNSLMTIDAVAQEAYLSIEEPQFWRALEQTSAAVARLDASGGEGGYDLKRFERFAIPEVYRFKLKYDLKPTSAVLRRFMQNNAKRYPQQDFIAGSVIRVPAVAEDPALSATLQALLSGLRTENFNAVAREYYEGIGAVSAGLMGRVTRGMIPGEEFDAFLRAQLGAPFFGPVAVPGGYLIGKLDAKFSTAADPFEQVSSTVVADYRREWAKKLLEDFYTSQTQRLQPRVHGFDAQSSAGTAQVAYEIGEHVVRFSETVQRLPHYLGDHKDPAFWNGMARHCLRDDLVLMSTATQEIVATPEYRYLVDAHRNAFLEHRHVEERLARLPTDEATLRAWYDERTSTTYARSDLVRLLAVQIPRTPNPENVSFEALTRHRDEFSSAAELRRVFAARPGESEASALARAHPGVSVSDDPAPRPADELGRLAEMGIDGLRQGDVTPVLVAPGEYVFAWIMERQPRGSAPFDPARVERDMMHECREPALSSLRTSRCPVDSP
jgi:hypothetical protein